MSVSMYHHNAADQAALDAEWQAALTAHSEAPTPETQAELLRLYDKGTKFKAGCGACRNGRNLVTQGIAIMAGGDFDSGLAKMKAGFTSVGFKMDRIRNMFK